MSTILDALKKVERDRELPHDGFPEKANLSPPPRRGIPTRVIIACASIGFAAGIGLTLWRDTAPLRQASTPEPVVAPIIDIPSAPAVAKAQPRVRTEPNTPPAAAPPNAAAPAAVAPAAVPPNAVAPGAGSPVEIAKAANPPAVSAPSAPSAPVVVGSAERGGSAIEPSPFTAEHPLPAPAVGERGLRGGHRSPGGAARDTPREPGSPGAVAAVAPPPPVAPPVVAVAPPPPVVPPVVVAVAPPPPVAPGLAVPLPAPEPPSAGPEGEPAQPPAVAIDTGRSPPGTPRVSLTFLQWSSDPDRRFAFVSIDGAPAQRVREGDTTSGMTVAQITPTGVQFKRESQLFMIRPRH